MSDFDNIWVTSDTHFGHANIIKYSSRPFRDVNHMNESIITNWNAVVGLNDLVYHLGDVALGNIDESLACVSRLNGYKVLINGNHDRPFMVQNKKEEVRELWKSRYDEVFQKQVMGNWDIQLPNRQTVLLSHFPFEGDSHDSDRYSESRPRDTLGFPLVHGHTHKDSVISFSSKGSVQIHVGQDAHNYTPVSIQQVQDYIRVAEDMRK